MKSLVRFCALTLAFSPLLIPSVQGQDDPIPAVESAETQPATPEAAPSKVAETTEMLKEKARLAGEKAKEIGASVVTRAEDMANSDEGRRTAGSILAWIESAEHLYRPWMNWLLVAIGIALFISHAGQLIIGKLWALIRGRGCNPGEILNDAMVATFSGLALPAVLFIPVGHGAFIQSPVAVLTSAAVGMIFGVYLYGHGMKQEMDASKDKKDD